MDELKVGGRTKELFDVLGDELALLVDLHSTHKALLGHAKAEDLRIHMMFPLLGAIISSSNCLANLLVSNFLNESYMSMRALFERCLNYCYLTCSTKEDFDNYFHHSLQKNLRGLRKELVVADFGFNLEMKGHEEIWDRPKVKKVMDDFSRKVSRKEVQNWSKMTKNRYERLEWVAKNINGILWEPYVLIEVMIFEEASEALHGTFFGTIFDTGYLEPRIQRAGKWVEVDHRTPQVELLVGYAVMLHNSIVQAAAHKYPNDSAVSRSKQNVLKAKDVLKETSKSVSIKEADDAVGILMPKED